MEKPTAIFGTAEQIVEDTKQPLIARRIKQNYNRAAAKKHYNENVKPKIKKQIMPYNKIEPKTK